jgi:hypothetical protein
MVALIGRHAKGAISVRIQLVNESVILAVQSGPVDVSFVGENGKFDVISSVAAALDFA